MQRLRTIEQLVATEQTTGRHVAPAIDCALAALRRLDYKELFELSVTRGIRLNFILSSSEYEALPTNKKQKAESQLEQTIVCHAVYGKAWIDCDRPKLYKIVGELRKSLSTTGKLVPFPSILDELFESREEAQSTTSRL